MAETRAILYGFWASSCSWRVRAALRFKNVPYDERAVDLLKQNQLSDEYKTINPAQKVPSLIIGSPLLNVPGIEQFSELKRLKKETKINLDTTIDTTRWRLRNAASRSSFHYNSLFLELDFPNEHWENLLLECKLRAGGTENLFECSDSYNYGQTSLQAETRAILYGFWASSCSWRVRAALRFKNVPYDERAVDLLKQNQLSDEYKTINPAQKVPSLIIGSPLLNVPGIEQFSELKRLKKETKINLDTTIDTTRWRLRNAASRSSFHYNSLFLELDFPNEHWENLLLECKLRAGGTENLFECSDSYNYGQTSLQVINYLQTEKGRLKALRLSEVKDGFISFGVISMSNGETIVESMAIIQYLDDIRPNPPLMPSTPLLRARVREICEIIVSGIQPLQNIGLKNQLSSPEQYAEFTKYWTVRGLQTLEDILKKSSGHYCVGNNVSIADICLVPQVFNAVKRFDLDLEQRYGTVSKLYKKLLEEDCIRETHPKKVKSRI